MFYVIATPTVTMEDLPRWLEEGRQPPGALVQEQAHSGSSESWRVPGNQLVRHRSRGKLNETYFLQYTISVRGYRDMKAAAKQNGTVDSDDHRVDERRSLRCIEPSALCLKDPPLLKGRGLKTP